MVPKKPTKQTHTWEITLIRDHGRLLGCVEAPDLETAIKVAIRDFEIRNPEQQKRLIARRLE